MAAISPGPTAARVRELLDYDQDTGVFRWRERPGMPNQMKRSFAGRVAGNVNRTGYRTIRIDGRMHNAQRIAWLYVTGEWPEVSIDHKNLVKDDNRFANLRKASQAQNSRNRSMPKNNTSGVKGVRLDRQTGKWRATIGVNRRTLCLGRYSSLDDAVAAYSEAVKKYHGEFAPL